ncbi:MAG: antitoxin VapB family protein [archaeon]
MEITTIAVTKEVKENIKEFGKKGETYSDILVRLVESANQRLLQDVLMDSKGFISIEEAIKEANKKWPK